MATLAQASPLPGGFPKVVSLLLNIGHGIDHMFLLIFATAVGSITLEFGYSNWGDLMPYSVGAFALFGLGALPAGRLGDLWGRRIMMITFFIGIGAASMLTALAQHAWDPRDQVALLWKLLWDDHVCVVVRIAGGVQSGGDALRSHSAVASGKSGIGFDQLLVEIAKARFAAWQCRGVRRDAGADENRAPQRRLEQQACAHRQFAQLSASRIAMEEGRAA